MRKKKSKLLFDTNEWTFDLINSTWDVIEKIARDKYGLDFYEPQFEIVDYDSMIINQSVTYGLPVSYSHWSFGKSYISAKNSYSKGLSGLAYELIINSDPSVVYMMENNSMPMQALVMAHAAVGHSSFFKNNYMFKDGVNPKYIIPFMNYAKEYVEYCESKYGNTDVEELLDMCHALSMNSIDRSKRRKHKKNMERKLKFNEDFDKNYNEIFKDFAKKANITTEDEEKRVWEYPEENILYFIEKNSKSLAQWEKEILRIVRMQAQYFYPQICTKLMNEGYATFWHYTITNEMYNQGYINAGCMLEILDNHCGVCHHPDSALTYKLNPYKLGFEIFSDIKRICENPTEEDKQFFPEFAGSNDWVSQIEYAMCNFNDSSFILQYLSPYLVRKLGLMKIKYSGDFDYEYLTGYEKYIVTHIQNDGGFNGLRKAISDSYSFNYNIPSVSIESYSSLLGIMGLKYNNIWNRKLNEDMGDDLGTYIKLLMGINDIKVRY